MRTNYLHKNQKIVKNIALVILGLIVSLIAVVFLVLFFIGMSSGILTTESIFITISTIIASTFVPVIGLNLLIHGLTSRWSSVDNWKELLFRTEKIVVIKVEEQTSESLNKDKEIMANDIRKIDFKIDKNKINDQYSQDLAYYKINLNITAIKEKVFTFNDLLQSRDYRIIAGRLQELVPFLEKHFTKNVLEIKLFDFNKETTLTTSLHFNRTNIMPVLRRSAMIATIHIIVWSIVWLLIYSI
jgi:hypothetical protein